MHDRSGHEARPVETCTQGGGGCDLSETYTRYEEEEDVICGTILWPLGSVCDRAERL